uniref:Uncharacterized protein n=1 Tax=Arundo donax TaxID=35708 RepID=A0A0A9C506_ARUDO
MTGLTCWGLGGEAGTRTE